MKSAGQLAYNAYRNSTGGVSLVSGLIIPPWSDLRVEIKLAWQAAGEAVWNAAIGEAETMRDAQTTQENASVDGTRGDEGGG